MQNQCSPRKFSFGIKKTLHYPYKVRWHLGNPFWITLKNHQTSTSLLWMLQSIYNYYVNHKVVSSYDKSYRFTCLKDCHPLLALLKYYLCTLADIYLRTGRFSLRHFDFFQHVPIGIKKQIIPHLKAPIKSVKNQE